MKDEKYLVQASEMLKDWFSDIKDLSQQPITKYPGFVKIWAEAWSVDDFQPMIDIAVEGSKFFGIIKILVEASSIPDKLFQAKVKKFVENFSKLSESDILKFIQDYQNNPKKTQKMGEALLLLLDKFENLNKAKLLGLFFVAKCKSEIDEEQYNTFAHALCNIDIRNINILKKYYDDFDEVIAIKKKNDSKIQKLSEQLKTANDKTTREELEKQKSSLEEECNDKAKVVDSEKYRTFLTAFANAGLLTVSFVSQSLTFAPPYFTNELGKKFIEIANSYLGDD